MYINFNFRKRKLSYGESYTWINANRLPYYNSSFMLLYAYGKSLYHKSPDSSILHPYWQIDLIEDGECSIIHNELKYPVKAGDIFICYPGNQYQQLVTPGTYLKRRTIMLNNSPLVSVLCNQSPISGKELLHLRDCRKVVDILDRLWDTVAVKNEMQTDKSQMITNTVFALFTEMVEQCDAANSHNSFENLLAAINDFQKFRSLNALADHFKVSPNTLNRLFKKYLNCTPVQYLIFSRMKLAGQLLRSNTMSVKDIAQMCGYNNVSFFCAEFKKYFKKSPLTFRGEKPIFSDREMMNFDKWDY